jgi:uncharacterized membrane protein
MRTNFAGYIAIFATIALTVYGQLVFKWQVDGAGSFPAETGKRIEYIVKLFVDPWVISVFVAVLAGSIAWALALTRFELSHAYPFMSLSFVLVLVFGVLFLSETLTTAKAVGVLLITAGLVIGSRF